MTTRCCCDRQPTSAGWRRSSSRTGRWREAAQLRAHIGIAGQYAAVDENLTGFENLEMVGRLYHLTHEEARKRGREVDPDAPFMPHGVPDETMAVRVDCSAVFERKFEALRAHRTQAEEIEAFPKDLRDEIFGTEWFVHAWPPAAPGGDPAPSLFAGLP